MTTLLELCHCGHHLATHHEGGACLGVGCNECPGYRDAQRPDTYRAPVVRPAHHDDCQCVRCKEYANAG